MVTKLRTVGATACAFSPKDIFSFECKICVRLTNLEEFLLDFSTDKDRLKEDDTPYKLLSELEKEVLRNFKESFSASKSVAVCYSKKRVFGDVIFSFHGFCYEEKSDTVIVDYTYDGTES